MTVLAKTTNQSYFSYDFDAYKGKYTHVMLSLDMMGCHGCAPYYFDDDKTQLAKIDLVKDLKDWFVGACDLYD